MAIINFASIAATLATIFEDRIASQINRSTVLLSLLRVGPGTGKDISWSARFGTAVGKSTPDGAAVTEFRSDAKVPATLQFGSYEDSFGLTGKAIAGAMAAGNPLEMVNLFGDEIGDSSDRLAKGIALDLYTGAGGPDQIAGLVGAPGAITSTGVYAGIDRALQPQWAGNEDSNGGVPRPLTFGLMRRMRAQIYTASGQKPDLIVCDPTVHQIYALLFKEQRRYTQSVRIRGKTIALDGGHQVLEFDGIPVVEDVDCPPGQMLFLNTRFIKVCQLPNGANIVNQGLGEIEVSGTDEEQFGEPQGSIKARINPLSRDGDAYKFQLICYPQLQVRRPNTCGRIVDIDTSV